MRWKRRPPKSNWGDFGVDDELGRLNLLTPERRLAAIREVKTGQVFCLSLPLDLPGGNILIPDRHPPVRGSSRLGGARSSINEPLRLQDPRYFDVTSDDSVTIHTQYSTQWDALAHVGRPFDRHGDGREEICYYNGFCAGADIRSATDPGGPGAARLGIEKMAETCVQGRGVMIDLYHHFGRDHRVIGYDDFLRVLEVERIQVETGDMVCLHTGYGQAIVDMAGRPDPDVLHRSHCALDGRDTRLLDWIDRSGLAALISDGFAVEAYPNETDAAGECAGLPLHIRCLFELGIHLGELWLLSELAGYLRQHGRSRFLLTAPPLRLPGSFGSPVTPVATV